MSKIEIGVAILGFGTVGRGVYELLADSAKTQVKHEVTFNVRKILVRDPKAPKFKKVPKALLTTDINVILNDPSIDVVVEVIGGTDAAKDFAFRALDAGKDIVTANKALMALRGDSLIARARKNGRYVGFQAAFTGCHQFGRSMASSVSVKSLVGIFNGTSNFILSRMEDGGLTQEQALKEAQDLGYAEADPSGDIDGYDTKNKLVLISMLAFGTFLDVNAIPMEGIRSVSKRDMDFAREMGYSIKLVGLSRMTEDGKVEARVHPCLVPRDHQLAGVKGVDNGIEVYDSLSDVIGMKAPGAGGQPTAMAILRDLISVAHGDQIMWPKVIHPKAAGLGAKPAAGMFYIRLDVEDNPGVLAIVAKILGKQKINIMRVIQPRGSSGHTALVILCGPAQEKQMKKALEEIVKSKVTKKAPVMIRVEDDFHALGRREGVTY